MLPLFAYGTLRDPELQQALFNRTFATSDATLHGYAIVAMPGGYYSAIKRPGALIAGSLVELDEAAYAIADRWEDLDVYTRTAGVALDRGGTRRPCFFYIRPDAAGEPLGEGGVATISREAVLADISRFRASL
jgi:gamma-glutamylcyclotransferase (GGCT)/AIG2-like uncharacterized protein YtfP